MGLRINQNIAAMNSYRNLSTTGGQMSKSLERLSSGFRINRAADDAAGLAISEKLRGQVGGLKQAVTNAQNGISLIQTAEGALNESHSILQRMRELAVQSSNDTNTSSDRTQIQKEVDQLSKELTRIGDSTEFNTKKLLNGDFSNAVFQIGANEGQTLNVSVTDVRAGALGIAGTITATANVPASTTTSTVTDTATKDAGTALVADGSYTIVDNAGTLELRDGTNTMVAGTTVDGTNGTITTTGGGGKTAAVYTFSQGSLQAGDAITVDSTQTAPMSLSRTVTTTTPATTASVSVVNGGLESGTYAVASAANAAGTYDVTDANGNQVGTYDEASGKLTDASGAELASFAANTDLKGSSFTASGFDVSSSSAAAQSAITTIQSAIDKVSEQRSSLGAIQNRLDHTINNLNVAAENLSASESRIRDTDMAAEMMSFTRAQILSQAGTAMLAQANQIPQGVLQLLR
jgi:flagellin